MRPQKNNAGNPRRAARIGMPTMRRTCTGTVARQHPRHAASLEFPGEKPGLVCAEALLPATDSLAHIVADAAGRQRGALSFGNATTERRDWSGWKGGEKPSAVGDQRSASAQSECSIVLSRQSFCRAGKISKPTACRRFDASGVGLDQEFSARRSAQAIRARPWPRRAWRRRRWRRPAPPGP